MADEIQVREVPRSGAEAAARGGVGAWWKTGTTMVLGIAAGTVVVHVATGARYGFDRDELMLLEDARHLAWGYVPYPPMTAFFGRLALELFGTSMVGFRFFAAVAQAAALVLTGLMAKEMGGGRWAQVVAAFAGVPFCLGAGALMQYISFDYVCWVFVAYCVVRLLTGGAGWWVGIGAGIGFGMMAKYTMAFLAVGVVAGVLVTDVRRYLKSKWLWIGAGLAVLIGSPNLIWQIRRNFVSMEFLRFLHERDVGTGVTDWFLAGQLELTLLAFPLAAAGLWFCFFSSEGKRYNTLGWMYAVPLMLFLVMRGRDYYLAPAYPMLYAAGAAWLEKWLVKPGETAANSGDLAGRAGSQVNAAPKARWVRRAIGLALAADVAIAGAVALPLAPVNSAWWRFAARVDVVFPEEIGWPEFVETVAEVRDRLPASERARLGILAGNYGEVGALNLYGEKYGLPRAISGVNSSWERGYGNPAPETLIVVGFQRDFLEKRFASCELAGRTSNRYGVANEETVEDPDIFVCRGLRASWEAFWMEVRGFA
jgi:4-amino-4-deoxy-L-arabinose transferase-like glycosyltransferase